MNKIKPGDWYARKATIASSNAPGHIKLPTDPRTLIRVYRAAIRLESAKLPEIHEAYTAFLIACVDAKKAKRVK